jgi:IclR family acetate operon transcriptional repressor
VHWPDGSVAGAVSVVGPTFRISDEKLHETGKLVTAHAQALSRELGMPDFDTASASASIDR